MRSGQIWLIDLGDPIGHEAGPIPLNGLSRTSYIQCEHVRLVSTSRAMRQVGVLDIFTLRGVDEKLRLLLKSAA